MAAKKRSKRGETYTEEVDAMFRQNRQAIYNAAYGVTGNGADAKDVLQNIFTKLIRGEPSLNFGKNPRGYLHKAAVNEAREVMRSRESQRLSNVELESLEIAAPEMDWEREEQMQRIRAAIARMDPDIVEILDLRYKEGYSCRQIAKIRGKPVATVVTEIFRARLELRKLIWIEEKKRETQKKEHQRDRKPLLADPSET